MPRGVMMVGTRPSDPTRDSEFNEWYDTTHLHEMCEIPGITSGRRYALSGAQMMPDATRHEYHCRSVFADAHPIGQAVLLRRTNVGIP